MNDDQANAVTADLEQCLLFLSQHFRMPLSAGAIRAGKVGLDPGMDVAAFLDAADRFGLTTALGRRDLRQLSDDLFPLVVCLGEQRAVVVLSRLDEDRVAVFDPVFGDTPVERSLEALQAQSGGRVIAVRPRHRPGSGATPVEDAGGHWFWSALSSNRWTYVQVMLAAALTNFLGLSTALFIMVVYDRVLPNEAMESLLALTLGVGIALVFDFLVKTLRAAFIEAAGQKADMRMGRRIFDHVLNLQMRSRRGSAGGFASTLREFETLRDFFASASLVALVDLPFILLFIWVISLIGGPLYLIPLLAVPLVLLMGLALQPFLVRISRDAYEQGRSKQGVLVETVTGLETIKAIGAAPLVRERWEESVRDQSGTGRRARAIQQFALNATAFAQQGAQVAIVVFGVFLIADGVISMGAMIAAVILTGRILAPLAQLAQTMTRINQARQSYQAIDQLMKLPSERPSGRRFLSRPDLRGRIEFQDVDFTYPDQGQPALRGINLVIEPGERVALLGRVGSGKSTLARLMLGIYEPDQGAVRVDNTDLRQLDPADLRGHVGSVLQEAWLLSGTVRQNIAVGHPHADDARILAAARQAGAHEFLARHPMGYDLMLGERGEGLSGGQRQLICLARALLGDPRILLLDEPTSAMDVQTEKGVIERLGALPRDRTLILVTHRTSLLALVDRVIVLDEGRVVADGPRERVLRNPATAQDPVPRKIRTS
ncbi:type I secretion system permease/ATPase [Ectothiorhodospira shaposhnikovii]|uniref:type I secretion system permease/ATPase n=1 Tax=Ectothiorhodospira shaposhnikovii TaxID=1054 RepID=UPI001EE8E1E5|nr:type I secretion system permease/ATPase [Ectothiorhodospira shaposhnikovii]MCG5514355.1 type I secretion system permease/ATPase [Ectothiorhodospira shaposhnikovii]